MKQEKKLWCITLDKMFNIYKYYVLIKYIMIFTLRL